MSTRNHPLVCILVLLALCLPTRALVAQGIRAEATLSRDRVHVGDEVQYQITIEGSQDAAPPRIDAPAGLTIEHAGSTLQSAPVMIVNGRRVDTGPDRFILLYRVVADRPGVFTIPEQNIRIAGQDRVVGPVRLTVTEPPADQTSILEVSLSSQTAYVGEPITLTLTWLFADARSVRFTTGGDRSGYELLPAPDPRPAGVRPNDARFATLRFDGQDTVCTLGRTVRAGREYGVVTATRTVIPRQPGEIQIGPFTAVAEVKTGERAIGMLLSEDIIERRASHSTPVTLQVRPLPTTGRPANFTGLVGRFGVEVAAEPTTVSVGDPIALRVRVTGPEPLERVDAPNLEAHPPFAAWFRLSGDGLRLTSDQSPGSRLFATTIRATTDAVREIPSVEIPYFDTQAGEYRIARSRPLPIEVRPTRQVTALDAIAAPAMQTPALARSPLGAASGGIVSGPGGPRTLRSDRADLRVLLTSPPWAAGVALPPMAFLTAVVYTLARRARGRGPVDAPFAARAALRVLASGRARAGGGEGARVALALRTFIAARFGVPIHAVTSYDAAVLLRDTDPDRADEVAGLLDRADAASRHGAEPPTADEAARLLRGFVRGASRRERRRRSSGAASAAGTVAAAIVACLWAPHAQGRDITPPNGPLEVLRAAEARYEAGLRAHERAPGSGTADFLHAAELLGSIITDHGIESAALHAFRGNALFLSGDLGRSIAAFRRAVRIDPTLPSARQGLAAARARVSTEVAREPAQRLSGALLAWRGHIPRSVLLAVAVGGMGLAWLLAAARVLGARRALPACLGAIVVSGFGAAPLAIEAIIDAEAEHAVVVASEVAGLNGPSPGAYEPTFDRPITAGVEVIVIERRGAWSLVRLADGRETWLPDDALERL